MKKLCVLLLLVIMAGSEVFAATAESLYWNGSSNSVLNNKANWRRSSNTGSTVCTELDATDTLNINKVTGTLTNTGTLSTLKNNFGITATTNYTINDSGTTTVATSEFLTRCIGAVGVYNKTGGTHTSGTGTYISWKGGTATLNISGSSTWNADGEFLIQDRGGTLDTDGVGTLNLNGGTVNVAGVFKVNNGVGTGAFNLNSGTFNQNSTDAQALITGGIGNIDITGTYNGKANTTVFSGGSGALRVRNGGKFNVAGLTLASGTVDVSNYLYAGGTIANTGNMIFAKDSARGYLSSTGSFTNSGSTTMAANAGATGELRVNGGSSYTTNGTTISNGGNGLVTVWNGGLYQNNGDTTIANSGTGNITVRDGAVYNNTGNTTIANGGTATLLVKTAGTYNNNGNTKVANGGNGTLSVYGAHNTGNTTLATNGGTGEIYVENGGTFTTGGSGMVTDGSTGNIIVRGGGTVNNTGNTELAMGGNATITVDAGGTFNTATNTNLSSGSGTGTLNLSGTYNTGSTTLASNGTGNLNVYSGGVLNTGSSTMVTGGTGNMNIYSGGSFNNTGHTFFARGYGANGTMNVYAGGTYNMVNGSYFSVARDGGSGTVNVYGTFGDLRATRGDSRICIGEVGSTGNLNVSDGLLKVGYIQFGWDGDTSGNMTISGTSVVEVSNNTFDAGLVLGGGVWTGGIQGYGANKLTLIGSQATVRASRLTMGSNDTLKFVLDGANGVGTGIVLTNEATLAGILDLSFASDYAAGIYTVLTASSITTEGLSLSVPSGYPAGWHYWVKNVEGGQALMIATPEPATVGLLSIGALALLRRRK